MNPKGGDDDIHTPDDLALAIVRHFQPTGTILEPCSGGGAFLRAFDAFNAEHADPMDGPHDARLWCVHSFEIKKGTDFLKQEPPPHKYDWIITNEPWSLYRPFLAQAFKFARNVVFLDKLNAFFSTKARFNIAEQAGYFMEQVALVEQPPPPWKEMGFQLAAVHFRERTPKEAATGLLGAPKIVRLHYDPKSTQRDPAKPTAADVPFLPLT